MSNNYLGISFVLIIVGVSIAAVSIPLFTAKYDDLRNMNSHLTDYSKIKKSKPDQKKMGFKCLIIGSIMTLIGVVLLFI